MTKDERAAEAEILLSGRCCYRCVHCIWRDLALPRRQSFRCFRPGHSDEFGDVLHDVNIRGCEFWRGNEDSDDR